MADLKKFAREILDSGVQNVDPDLWNRVMNTTDDMRTSIAPCVKCGLAEYSIRYSQPMRDNLIMIGMCFSCHFWYEMMHTFEDGYSPDGKRQVIVEGQHYAYDTAEPIKDKSIYGFLGHGGAEFRIKFDDRDWIEITNDLWCQGTIPEIWLPDFPNNAIFIPTPNPYMKLHTELANHFKEKRNND